MAKKPPEPPPIESREFRSPEEIDGAIAKFRRRIDELDKLDVQNAYLNSTGAIETAVSNVRQNILEVFGPNSPEYNEHKYIELWAGPQYINMSNQGLIAGMIDGRRKVIGILNGLIGRLEEKKLEFGGAGTAAPSTYFDRLDLHPRIRDVSRDLFVDRHSWEAVFAASKALINYVKERSDRHDLDGTPLVQTVFSKKNPILTFNEFVSQVDFDEQEGMMHLFEGAVLAMRNPGGHDFPKGSDQRAIEYISFLSLLAYRLQDAKRRK
jgi:uncharacterized protein (TIGR02391 family)